MIHTTPTKALLATTLRPLVVQLSSALAHGARLIDHFLHQEPTPQKMATFERELRTLLQEVGRRIMAWVLNHMEPEGPEEMPARLWWKGQAYRRRRKHRTPRLPPCLARWTSGVGSTNRWCQALVRSTHWSSAWV
jgi:type II secretory pathway component PulJ